MAVCAHLGLIGDDLTSARALFAKVDALSPDAANFSPRFSPAVSNSDLLDAWHGSMDAQVAEKLDNLLFSSQTFRDAGLSGMPGLALLNLVEYAANPAVFNLHRATADALSSVPVKGSTASTTVAHVLWHAHYYKLRITTSPALAVEIYDPKGSFPRANGNEMVVPMEAIRAMVRCRAAAQGLPCEGEVSVSLTQDSVAPLGEQGASDNVSCYYFSAGSTISETQNGVRPSKADFDGPGSARALRLVVLYALVTGRVLPGALPLLAAEQPVSLEQLYMSTPQAAAAVAAGAASPQGYFGGCDNQHNASSHGTSGPLASACSKRLGLIHRHVVGVRLTLLDMWRKIRTVGLLSHAAPISIPDSGSESAGELLVLESDAESDVDVIDVHHILAITSRPVRLNAAVARRPTSAGSPEPAQTPSPVRAALPATTQGPPSASLPRSESGGSELDTVPLSTAPASADDPLCSEPDSAAARRAALLVGDAGHAQVRRPDRPCARLPADTRISVSVPKPSGSADAAAHAAAPVPLAASLTPASELVVTVRPRRSSRVQAGTGCSSSAPQALAPVAAAPTLGAPDEPDGPVTRAASLSVPAGGRPPTVSHAREKLPPADSRVAAHARAMSQHRISAATTAAVLLADSTPVIISATTSAVRQRHSDAPLPAAAGGPLPVPPMGQPDEPASEPANELDGGAAPAGPAVGERRSSLRLALRTLSDPPPPPVSSAPARSPLQPLSSRLKTLFVKVAGSTLKSPSGK